MDYALTAAELRRPAASGGNHFDDLLRVINRGDFPPAPAEDQQRVNVERLVRFGMVPSGRPFMKSRYSSGLMKAA